MLSDERYKQLMESVGMPNSNSLLTALQQCAMEATLIERYGLDKRKQPQIEYEKYPEMEGKTFLLLALARTQIEYENYEFCKDVNCSGLYNKCCVYGCYHTAKGFHNWLQENNFKIIKDIL